MKKLLKNNVLHNGLSSLGLSLSEEAQSQLLEFLTFLQKWNKAYNLTAITDFDRMVKHHLLDSLSITPYVKGENIIDIGSGAGFPGIPLAVYFPSKHFVLLDSVGKKTRFIQQAVRHLGLTNVEVVHSRAEHYQTSTRFDTMTSRAVGSIDYLVSTSQHLLGPKGRLLVMKTEVTPEVLSRYSQAKVITLSVPGIESNRSLVIIETMGNE